MKKVNFFVSRVWNGNKKRRYCHSQNDTNDIGELRGTALRFGENERMFGSEKIYLKISFCWKNIQLPLPSQSKERD